MNIKNWILFKTDASYGILDIKYPCGHIYSFTWSAQMTVLDPDSSTMWSLTKQQWVLLHVCFVNASPFDHTLFYFLLHPLFPNRMESNTEVVTGSEDMHRESSMGRINTPSVDFHQTRWLPPKNANIATKTVITMLKLCSHVYLIIL